MKFYPVTVWRQYSLGILGRYRVHYSNGRNNRDNDIILYNSCLIIVCVFDCHLWLRAHWGLFLYGYPVREAPINPLCMYISVNLYFYSELFPFSSFSLVMGFYLLNLRVTWLGLLFGFEFEFDLVKSMTSCTIRTDESLELLFEGAEKSDP